MKLPRLLGTLMLTAALAGCMVGPDYKPPDTHPPKSWHSSNVRGVLFQTPSPQTLAQWWTTLNDPILTKLEERAVKGNLNLKKALWRVREARALRGMEKARLFPYLNAQGSAQEMRSSAYEREEYHGKKRRGEEGKLYQIGLDSSWEIDIFGSTRRSVEAAQAEVEAAQENLHDVLVSLTAEVALNYVEVRMYQARLRAAMSNMEAQREIYTLNLSRYKAGLIDELAVEQSLYILENTKAQIPALETALERAMNRLAVLVGQRPGTLHRLLRQEKPIPVPPLKVAVGIPADTLRQRPDVRRAERMLAAETARIGEAKAQLYPFFNLAGTVGLESVSSGHLWEWVSRTSGFGLHVFWQVFHAGELRKQVEAQEARQKEALMAYQESVLKALEEVENALVAYGKEQQRLDSLRKAAASAKRAYLLAVDRYKAGLVDFTNVMDAQRSLQLYQDRMAESEGAVAANLVRLYKALGGGWSHREPRETERQASSKSSE